MPEKSLQQHVYDTQNSVDAIRRTLKSLSLVSTADEGIYRIQGYNEIIIHLNTIQRAMNEIGAKGGLLPVCQLLIDQAQRYVRESEAFPWPHIDQQSARYKEYMLENLPIWSNRLQGVRDVAEKLRCPNLPEIENEARKINAVQFRLGQRAR